MATVRFSDTLRNTIRDNANRLFRDRLSKINEPDNTWAKAPAEVYYAWATELTKDVPAEFFKTAEKLAVSRIVVGEETYRVGMAAWDFPKPVPVPQQRVDDSVIAPLGLQHFSVSYGACIDASLDGTDPRWASIVEQVKKQAADYAQAEEERDKFLRGVEAIINNYSTLAPALKEWPPLWDLLDSDAQERHKRIVERKKSAAVTTSDGAAVDLDSMTAAVTVAKLRGNV